MRSVTLEKLIVRLQKARIILMEEGWSSLWTRVGEKTYRRKVGHYLPKTSLYHKQPQVYFVGKKLNSTSLATLLSKKLKDAKFVLAVSHDDFTSNIGGVQISIAKEQQTLNQQGIHFLHVFPYGAGITLVHGKEYPVMGISFDGERVGFAEGNDVLQAFTVLKTDNLLEMRIHHTMGHNLRFIQEMIDISKSNNVKFWVHDFFSICQGYFLLRNNLEYCGAPAVNSNACQVCMYGLERKKHNEEFFEFFNKNRFQVNAPSQFAMDLWTKTYPTRGWQKSVKPHVTLQWEPPTPQKRDHDSLKIAFVGYPVFHKGFSAWLKLTEEFAKDERYQFYLASSERVRSKHFRRLPLTKGNSQPNKMVAALALVEVDVAFLWSICPETFSYTLYESLSAGCYIVTNRNSGNIQAYVKVHPETGLVLDDEKTLMELFDGDDLVQYVAKRQKEGRTTAKIVKNGDC